MITRVLGGKRSPRSPERSEAEARKGRAALTQHPSDTRSTSTKTEQADTITDTHAAHLKTSIQLLHDIFFC